MNGVRHGRSRAGRALLFAPLLTLALLAGAAGCADDDGDSDVRKPVPRESRSSSTADKPSGGEAGSPAAPGDQERKDGEHGEDAADGRGSGDGGPSAAADGTDTGACEDAECEVELSAGDELHPQSSYGVEEFTVESIEDHVITWTAHFGGGRVSMSAKGAEESSTSCTNGTCSGRLGRTKGSLQMNGITVEFTSVGEDRAVAEVSTGK